ncbi:Uncharacterised protein [Mycobacteroides abscessus subsp. abscessus]|nr:Uncharacterised protein [Mycobacteroides abscessus subsp. abscessus]
MVGSSTSASISSPSSVIALITNEWRSGTRPSARVQGAIHTHGNASSVLSLPTSGACSRCTAGRSTAEPSPRSATT